MNDYTFGNFVCMLREKKGLTQADIAQQLGVTPAAVSKWENGSSKPRVEVLFRLANILEAKPEELMAGHYIVEETSDPAVVRQINERYEYLRKIDSCATTKVKMRRVLAFVIDWNIVGFLVLTVLSTTFSSFLQPTTIGESNFKTLIALFIMLLYPVLFILRDFIMGGRSVGKRILGLIVVDKNTGEIAKSTRLVIRNLFLFLMQIDVVVLLVSGASIGDRVAHTAVILKKELDNTIDTKTASDAQRINDYIAPKPVTKKKIIIVTIIIVSTIVLFVALVLGIVTVALNAKKNSEEYKLAYNYLVESNLFDELDIDEDKVKLRSFEVTSKHDQNGDVVKTAEFGFSLSGKTTHIICHYKNNAWYVCPECTEFD